MRRLSIGQFSQATRLSIKALRLYADRGLLTPIHIDPESGYRYYASDQLMRAGLIHALRGIGMPLQKIEQFLNMEGNEARLELLDHHAAALTHTLEQISNIRATLRAPNRPPAQDDSVRIESADTRCIAGVRVKTDLHHIKQDIQSAFSSLYSKLALAGDTIEISGTPMLIYHDAIDEQGGGEVEVGVPIREPLNHNCALRISHLEGSTVAVILHQGPHDQVGEAYRKILNSIASRNLAPDGPPREIYLNDPAVTHPAQLLIRIEFPIQPVETVAK